MNITKDTLKENNWRQYESQNIILYGNTIIYKNKVFHLTIQQYSNTIGRDWFLHVDNDRYESIGSMDVATFEQIDRFLDLLID